jgi:hypothetical protein
MIPQAILPAARKMGLGLSISMAENLQDPVLLLRGYHT